MYEKVALRIRGPDAIVALVPPSFVKKVIPNHGPKEGGTAVTITGKYFTNANTVNFGENPGTNLIVVDDRQITVNTPARQAKQTVQVTVTTPSGTGSTGESDQFSYD